MTTEQPGTPAGSAAVTHVPNPATVRCGTPLPAPGRAASPVRWLLLIVLAAVALSTPNPALAQKTESETAPAAPQLEFTEIVEAGGVVGFVILALSIAMLALVVEHALSIRRGALIPEGLAEQVHGLVAEGRFKDARTASRESASFLGSVLDSGLAEQGLGYPAMEKAMEDTAAAQTSRLFRKIEYLSIIGTIAPMLGLLGTVWGMIQAFMEFQTKTNPQVAELAPGIYKALVTTLLGLGVAVPALAGFAIFRNRIDALADDATQLAEHVFDDYRRGALRKSARKRDESSRGSGQKSRPSPVAAEREPES